MSLCKSCNTGISDLLKCFLFASFTLGTLTAISAPRPANIPFVAADDLNYKFLPKQKHSTNIYWNIHSIRDRISGMTKKCQRYF